MEIQVSAWLGEIESATQLLDKSIEDFSTVY